MKEKWLLRYDAMLIDMASCSNQVEMTMSAIECRFNLAQTYWSQILADIEDHIFLSKSEEIHFYKIIKPLFKSQIEYYNLVYQAELLKPVNNPGEMKEFWIREHLKLERFIRDNGEICQYYNSGDTHLDEQYFLSPVSENAGGKTLHPDDLLVTLIALQRFQKYTRDELARI